MHAICIGTRDLRDLIQGLLLPLRDSMDPFSIVVGVLGTAVATAEAAKALYELVDGVRHAPDEIIVISKDTHAFYNIVYSLEMSLKNPTIRDMVSNEEALAILVGNLKDPLTNCSAALGRLMVKIQSVIRPLDDERSRMSSNELKWYFMKKEVKELTDQVERTKATLNSAQTNVITYCTLSSRAQNNGSSVGPIRRRTDDTDAGFALWNYAKDKEASFYENPVTSASSTLNSVQQDFKEQVALQSGNSPTPYPVTKTVVEEPVVDNAERLRRAENQRNGLINAAKEGDDLVLELMIQEGANVNAKDKHGKAALHYAAASGNVEIAQILLDNHANINLKTTPKGSPIDRKFYGERTPLYWAASEGHEDMARMLVQNAADPNIQNSSGRTALQAAIKHSKDGVSRFLIDNGADITLSDNEKWTALHEAAHQGRTDIVRILLDKGADCEAKTSEETIWGKDRHWFCGATPLFLASGNGYRATVEYLMQRGANVNTRNTIGEMAIHNVCWRGFKLLVLLYLDAGIGIEERDTIYQETPLIKAASTGQTDVIRLLLERGADIQARNPHGRRALEHARLHRPNGENAEAIKVLEDWYAAAES